MALTAKPSTATYQSTDIVGLHGLAFVPIVESSGTPAEVIGGAAITYNANGDGGATTAPSIVSASFGGTTANLLRYTSASQIGTAAVRGTAINSGNFSRALVVAFRPSAFPATNFATLADASNYGDFGIALDSSGNFKALYNGGSFLPDAGLATILNHDYLFFLNAKFDGSTVSVGYALYDYTVGSYVTPTGSLAASGNISTWSYGGGYLPITGVVPCDLHVGGLVNSANRRAQGDYYSIYYEESTDPTAIYGPSQLAALVADPLKAIRPSAMALGISPSSATNTANGTTTFTVTGTNVPSYPITVTISDGGAGGTFSPTSLNITSSAGATFVYSRPTAGSSTITASSAGATSATAAFTATGASGLSIAAPTLSSVSKTGAVVAGASATGGSGAVTYAWSYSTTAGGVYNSIASSNTSGVTITGLAPFNDYTLKRTTADSASVLTHFLQFSTQPPINLGLFLIGDSRTNQLGLQSTNGSFSAQLATAIKNGLSSLIASITIDNQGAGGSDVAGWQPGGTLMNTADASTALSACDYIIAIVNLGANDGLGTNTGTQLAAGTYGSRLATIVNHILATGTAAGAKPVNAVIVERPNPIVLGGTGHTPAMQDAILSYGPYCDAMENGSTIFAGDRRASHVFLNNPAMYSDQTHFATPGFNLQVEIIQAEVKSVLLRNGVNFPIASGGGAVYGRLSSQLRRGR